MKHCIGRRVPSVESTAEPSAVHEEMNTNTESAQKFTWQFDQVILCWFNQIIFFQRASILNVYFFISVYFWEFMCNVVYKSIGGKTINCWFF